VRAGRALDGPPELVPVQRRDQLDRVPERLGYRGRVERRLEVIDAERGDDRESIRRPRQTVREGIEEGDRHPWVRCHGPQLFELVDDERDPPRRRVEASDGSAESHRVGGQGRG
jgi:hypothetical protein